MNYDGVRESEFFMKKFILMLLVILLMPATVLAETCHADGITIESIETIEKSEGTKELSSAKANGTYMDLDISFTREKDYIIYKIVIKNNTENDYVLDEAMFTKNYNNVSYKFETDNKLVKAGNVRELSLRVELISIPENGHFNEKNTLDLNLTGGAIENPPTGVKSLLYVIPVLLIIGFLVVFTAKKKTSFKAMALLVGLLVSIPTIVNAVCKCNLKVNSTITVSNCKYKLITDKGTFEEGKDVKDICVGANEVADSSEFICKGFTYYSEYDAAAYFGDDDTPTITEATSFGDRSISPKMLFSRPANAYAYMIIYSYKPSEPLFNDKSYIKVYSDYEKKNLIKTITKNDIDGHYYVLEENKYLDTFVVIPLGEYGEVYFTVSRDLYNKIDIDVDYDDPEDYHENSCPAGSPIITSSIVIDKIESMIYSVDDEDQALYGFSNCQNEYGEWVMKPNNYRRREFESRGLRRTPVLRGASVYKPSQITCAGNEYHAVWGNRIDK